MLEKSFPPVRRAVELWLRISTAPAARFAIYVVRPRACSRFRVPRLKFCTHLKLYVSGRSKIESLLQNLDQPLDYLSFLYDFAPLREISFLAKAQRRKGRQKDKRLSDPVMDRSAVWFCLVVGRELVLPGHPARLVFGFRAAIRC
jgi:hypothetical protein